MMSQSSEEPANIEADKAKAETLAGVLRQMHPELQWSLYPLGDYNQYAEADAPEWLVSFGSDEQELECGLVDPYSNMLGDTACDPASWGISDAAAKLIQAHNKVFVVRYPNCDGPRYQNDALSKHKAAL